MREIAAVILAAGKGTRMNEGQASPIPKVMFEINGRPMIGYSVEAVRATGVGHIVLVVGYKHEMVESFVGETAEYVLQEQQLGTGHAVACAKESLRGKSEGVLVCYGDNPLYRSATIKKLMELFEEEQPAIALLSAVFDNPRYWAFGRIVRDELGKVLGIVEQKDCTEEQLDIKESNAGFYIFDAEWLWENCDKLSTANAQGEYYLTDLVGMAVRQGKKVIATPVTDPNETLGVNNLDQLAMVEDLLRQKELAKQG